MTPCPGIARSVLPGGSVGLELDLGGNNGLAAALADDDGGQLGAARAVTNVELGRRPVQEMPVGPRLDGEYCREEVKAGRGELVLVPVGISAVADALQ